jgi:HK97 family phage prohead protease
MPLDAARSKMEINDREIKGYPIVWGSLNDCNETVVKGATLKSLAARGTGAVGGNRILVLLHHDQRRPLCLPTELYEDDYGLFFRARIDEGVSYCDDACASIRQGTLSQLSYGFNYVWDDNATVYDGDRDAYVLREIDLYELSVLAFSSDPLAQLREQRRELVTSLFAGFGPDAFYDPVQRCNAGGKQNPDNESDCFNNFLKMF